MKSKKLQLLTDVYAKKCGGVFDPPLPISYRVKPKQIFTKISVGLKWHPKFGQISRICLYPW